MKKKDIIQIIICIIILIALFIVLGVMNNNDVKNCIENGGAVNVCQELKQM